MRSAWRPIRINRSQIRSANARVAASHSNTPAPSCGRTATVYPSLSVINAPGSRFNRALSSWNGSSAAPAEDPPKAIVPRLGQDSTPVRRQATGAWEVPIEFLETQRSGSAEAPLLTPTLAYGSSACGSPKPSCPDGGSSFLRMFSEDGAFRLASGGGSGRGVGGFFSSEAPGKLSGPSS